MGVSHNKQLITMRREINHAKYPESIFSRTLATLKSTFLALMVGCPLRTHSGIPQVKILVAEAIMYHKFTNDIEKGGDSPSHSTDNDEVVSPMYELQQPHLTTEPKMLSPSDRATSGGSARLTIAVKQASLKKKMKRAASLCMAVVLLAGGLVRKQQSLRSTLKQFIKFNFHYILVLNTDSIYIGRRFIVC